VLSCFIVAIYSARKLLCRAQVMERPGHIGEYVLGDELGVGGMGRVYAAANASGASVALKLLHPDLAADRAFAERLIEEGRLARLVSHRNVVRVLDGGTTLDGTPFLVMRRAPGTSLATLIGTHGALALVRIRRIATQILDGVAAIHSAGLVHGDLKSDNILIGKHDRVTIIDFGLARAPATTPSWLGENVLSGTPEYMAPEVIRGEAMTQAADLYAVGIIIYEMLTARTPFAGGSVTAVCQQHLCDDAIPPSLRCVDRTMPVALEALVMRALAKDPSHRHYSAALFSTALGRAIPATWSEDTPPAVPRTVSTQASTRTWERHPPRRFAKGTRDR
jgi:eukaryotic-like serine/threonine-protein kinase